MKKVLSNKKLIAGIVLIIIVGIIVNSYRINTSTIAVREVVPVRSQLSQTVAASGTVVSQTEVNLSFANGGVIMSLSVSKGDKVQKGQLLGRVDTAVMESNVQAARDARDIVLRNRDLFLQQYQNKPSLVGGKKQYDIQLRTINEQVSQAEAGLDAAKANLSKSYLYSPVNSTVVDVIGHAGEVATPGAPVVRLANTELFHFEISLDQEDITRIKLGQQASLQLDSYPNREINAYVSEITSFANPAGNFTVKLSVDAEPDSVIYIGMTGDAYIEVESTEGEVTALGFDEIYAEDDGQNYIWVLDSENKLQKRMVTVGLEGDIYYEIKDSIEEKIVVPVNSNGKTITEGTKAKLVN